MKKKLYFLLAVVSFVAVSCSQTNTQYREPSVSSSSKFATINSYQSGGDYLIIEQLDGKEIPKAKQYLVSPGRRHLVMSAVYKGLLIEKMQYSVKVEAGKIYSLKPSLSEISEHWLPTKSEFRTRSFMPLFLDDQSGKQLYPPLPKN